MKEGKGKETQRKYFSRGIQWEYTKRKLERRVLLGDGLPKVGTMCIISIMEVLN
jgi:hypothetical protein